ncbi:MAG: tetratricopeptide repeat protein [Chloroflexi bacterium]|nr:tetratricopeptide repeat protein [Chloroflexota bacterium]MBP8057371.1 tetratricopeptide repeat protein [Chloroflexota bacterium]
MANNRERYAEALRRGLAYNVEKKWQSALREFRQAIQEFPNEPTAYAGLGEACFGLNQIDRALECYKLAARYSQGNVNYLNKVADFQERLGQLSEAGKTYMAVGEIYLRNRDLDNAESNWLRAVRLEPNLLGAHQRLATVYQRQGKIRSAVREYLAIARILQLRGEKEKALQMCYAALRLEPDSPEVQTAIELVKYGEEAFREEEEPELDMEPAQEITPQLEPAEPTIADTIRQMAAVFEQERQKQAPPPQPVSSSPVDVALKLAQEQLAEELFRDEEDEAELYGTSGAGLSKLERDALIGQGMDFQSRGRVREAIECYEKAVRGGLKLPSVHFTLGALYMELTDYEHVTYHLERAGQDKSYWSACRELLGRIEE